MAKNTGTGSRVGSVKVHTPPPVQNIKTGDDAKRDAKTGRFTDHKSGDKPSKGAVKEKEVDGKHGK